MEITKTIEEAKASLHEYLHKSIKHVGASGHSEGDNAKILLWFYFFALKVLCSLSLSQSECFSFESLRRSGFPPILKLIKQLDNEFENLEVEDETFSGKIN